MLYFGEFRDRFNDLITVRLDSHGDKSDIFYGNITNKSKENFIEVDTQQFFVETGGKIVIERNGTYVLSKVRLFKGCAINMTKISGPLARYVITDLEMKEAKVRTTNYVNNNPITYVPDEDGYLLINSSRIGITNIEAVMNRQQAKEVIFSDNPVTINTNSEGFYAPFKINSATVRLMTEDIYYSLYTTDPQGVSVEIANKTRGNEMFNGYITPCIYDQNFVYPYNELEVECVSPISTLADIKFETEETGLLSWYEILKHCVNKTNFYDSFSTHNFLKVDDTYEFVKRVYVKAEVLRDGDELLDCKKIIENFCTTFNLSLVEFGRELIFINYAELKDDTTYTKFFPNGTSSYLQLPDPIINVVGYASDSHDISFDDVYGTFKIECDTVANDDADDIINLDNDNLICLHPNIDYIEFDSAYSDSDLYTDTKTVDYQVRHHDLYRFYIIKDYRHLCYHSNFSWNDPYYTSGYNTRPWYFDITTQQELLSKTNANEWWNYFHDNILSQNLCAFVIKHFQYDTTDYDGDAGMGTKKAPSTIKWETSILFSYGLKNITYGNYKTVTRGEYSNALRETYAAARNLNVLVSNKYYNLVKSPHFETYLQCEGSVYFMRNRLLTQCDTFNSSDLAKDTLTLMNVSGYAGAYYTYQVGLDLANGEIDFTDNTVYKIDGLSTPNLGYPQHFKDRDKVWDICKDQMYKWHSMKDDRREYTDNLKDPKGDCKRLKDNYNTHIRIYAPSPFIKNNTLQVSYAMVKGMKLTLVKSYPPDIAIEEKEGTDELIYTKKVNNYKEEYTIDLPYITQPTDKDLFANSLFMISEDTQEFDYLVTVDIDDTQWKLEDYLIEVSAKHYGTPKLIYNCTLTADKDLVDLNPLNTFTPDATGKEMLIDNIEYDVLNQIKQIKLIQL